MNKNILVSTALFAVFVTANARADLITFDEIDAVGTGGVDIPNGYYGLDWMNFAVINGNNPIILGTGYERGVVSPLNVAFNTGNSLASFSSTTNYFDFESMYVTRAFHDGWINLQGYAGDIQKYVTSVFATTASPELVTLNWTGITRVKISDGCLDCSVTAIDNMIINFGGLIPPKDTDPIPPPVPEPSTYAMLLAGLGLVGFVSWRRQRGSR